VQHCIKIKRCYLEHILENKKTFEVRKNDRDYQVGDTLVFNNIEEENFTGLGNIPIYKITYIHSGIGLNATYVILGIINASVG
jgi:ASC-1-like (ASCH) protein